MVLLVASGVSMSFGGVRALDAVDLEVHAGQIVALIGPNGAGKTTFLNCVSGAYAHTSGTITFDGHPLRGTPTTCARLGIGRTFQSPEVFRRMTVLENVLTPLGVGPWWHACQEALGTLGSRRRERRLRARAMAIAEAFELGAHLTRPAGELPLGLLRRLELAQALAHQPRLLLLDEPASGLDTNETAVLGEQLIALRDELGFAALLVEHDMALVDRISDHTYVLDFGRVLASGPMAEIRRDPKVAAAYLGERKDEHASA